MSLVSVRGLCHRYGAKHPWVVNDINLTLAEGETVAVVGRSGCGKSTLSRLLTGLEPPTRGSVYYRDTPLSSLNRTQHRAFRRDVQLVFQDAFSAVNPRMRIGDITAEPLRYLTRLNHPARREKAQAMLAQVGLDEQVMARLPAQLSGGQLQRVCLARALIINPRLVILDEAVSSLDVVIQAQIIALLRQQTHTAFLFITHDLRLVEDFCQRVVVMENGRIAEDTVLNGQLQLTSQPGLALQQAILPALPSRSGLQATF